MAIDPLVKILDRPLSDYNPVSQQAILTAQREWRDTHVTNLDGTSEHKEFVMRRARELRGVDPVPPVRHRNDPNNTTRLNGDMSNSDLPRDNVRREEIERDQQADFGYIRGAEVEGGHKYAPKGDYDETGKTYGRISTRPPTKYPWQDKRDLRRY